MIRAIILEDEPLAAEHLKRLLAQCEPLVEIIDVIPSVKKGIAWLDNHSCDLIFVDINLADGECFRIFEEVEVNTPVIFTTAYDQYAIRAFELNSVDYLMKPVSVSQLKRSLTKFKSIHGRDRNHKENLENLISGMLNRKINYKKRFLIETGSQISTIPVSDIAYFYTAQKNVFLRHWNGRTSTVDLSLEKLDGILDPQFFFRINRSCIVNIESITGMSVMSNRTIKLSLKPLPDPELADVVSVARFCEFRKWLNL